MNLYVCKMGLHSTHIYMPMKMEQTECSEMLAYKLQTPGVLPKRKHTTYRTRQKLEM